MTAALDIVDLGDEVDYREAWQTQRVLWERRTRDSIHDTVLLLEHSSVYTAGVNTTAEDRRASKVDLIDVDRGGRVTWHGPGQLVGYPIVRIARSGLASEFVHAIEGLVIATCERLEVSAGRVPGRPGVWTEDGRRKLASIGVRVRRGVTMHGFALNYAADLTAFASIVACGITDASMSTLGLERGSEITSPQVRSTVSTLLRDGALDLGEVSASTS